MQVSSDLSIVDLDIPFALVVSLGTSLNAYSNLGVLAVVTWQVLFVSVPMIVLSVRLQVTGFVTVIFGSNYFMHQQMYSVAFFHPRVN